MAPRSAPTCRAQRRAERRGTCNGNSSGYFQHEPLADKPFAEIGDAKADEAPLRSWAKT